MTLVYFNGGVHQIQKSIAYDFVVLVCICIIFKASYRNTESEYVQAVSHIDFVCFVHRPLFKNFDMFLL